MGSLGKSETQYPKPLKPSGVLEKFSYDDSTPAIGREFNNVNIVDDIINAQNADELIRDLGITSKLTINGAIKIGTGLT